MCFPAQIISPIHVTQILKKKRKKKTFRDNEPLFCLHITSGFLNLLPNQWCYRPGCVNMYTNTATVWVQSHKIYYNLTDTGRKHRNSPYVHTYYPCTHRCLRLHTFFVCKTVTFWAQNDWNIGLKGAGINPLYNLCHYSIDSGCVLFFFFSWIRCPAKANLALCNLSINWSKLAVNWLPDEFTRSKTNKQINKTKHQTTKWRLVISFAFLLLFLLPSRALRYITIQSVYWFTFHYYLFLLHPHTGL